ncbi:MAG: cation:dicarboxylase symporter family transporter, partial [Bacteroidetes bacterium]|nr:cation:dicarboxylase symporter family transporter [Bacteroidota bacterium]
MKKIFTNLTFWVLIAITAGILLGHFAPSVALEQILPKAWKARFMGQDLSVGSSISEFFSGLFISLVKLFINPIIFLTIIIGIVSMGNLKKVGRVGAKAILYFEIVTTFALIIGVIVAMIIRPGHGVITSSVQAGDISKYKTGSQHF